MRHAPWRALAAAAFLLAACQSDPYAGLEARRGAEEPRTGPYAYRHDAALAGRYPAIADVAFEPVLSATGLGSEAESARSNAYLVLEDRIRGLPVSGQETIGDRVGPDGRPATLLSVFVKRAVVLEEASLPGGTFAVRVGIGFEDLRSALGMITTTADDSPARFEPDELDRLSYAPSVYDSLIASSETGLALVVASPAAESRVDRTIESVAVRGTAVGRAGISRLFVRNATTQVVVEVPLESPGSQAGPNRFLVAVPLAAGKNALEVVAVDPGGQEVRIEVIVFRSV